MMNSVLLLVLIRKEKIFLVFIKEEKGNEMVKDAFLPSFFKNEDCEV